MKRIYALLLAVVMLVGLAVGCQSTSNSNSASSNAASDEKVTLSFYIWDEVQGPDAQKMIDGFKKTHPNIDIELTIIPFNSYMTKIATMLSTGTGPDVCWLNVPTALEYMPKGALTDMTPLIERDGYDMSKLNPNIAVAYTYDGHQYAVPKDIDTVVVCYNKELFDAANQPYPSNDWTWEDFREVAKNTTIDGVQWGYANFMMERTYYSIIQSNGGLVLSEDCTAAVCDNDVVKNSLQFLHDMADVDHSTPSGPEAIEYGENTLFLSGKVAMDCTGTWNMAPFAEALGDKLGIAEMPTGSVGKAPISHGLGYVIPSGCEHPAEAWEFVKYLGSAEAQAMMADTTIPAHADVSALWAENFSDYDLTAVNNCLGYAVTRPFAKVNASAVHNYFDAAVQEIWLGSDINAALKTAEDNMNSVLK